MIDAQPSRWLEALAGACLGTGADDCRLGDLCEQYVDTRQQLLARFGGTPGGSLAAGLLAHGRYLGAAANVILFARVVEPVLRMAESNTMGLLALELRERLMNAFTFAVRRFALPALLLLCGALLVNSAYESWIAARQSEALMASAQRGKAEFAAQRIASFVDDIQRQIGWVTYLQYGAKQTMDQRRFDYVRLLRQVPAITMMTQLDREGREQLVVNRLAMDIVDSGIDRSGEPAFVQAQKKVFIGPLYYRKASEPYVTMAMPIGMGGGVVVAEVNLKPVWDTIRGTKVDDGGYAYIVDGKGRLLAYHDIKFVLRQPNLMGQPQVKAAVEGSAPAQLVEGRSFDPDSPATSVLSASAPVSAPVPGLDWKVLVDVRASAYEVPRRNALIRTIAMAGLGLVAMILAVVLAMRPIVPTRPAQA